MALTTTVMAGVAMMTPMLGFVIGPFLALGLSAAFLTIALYVVDWEEADDFGKNFMVGLAVALIALLAGLVIGNAAGEDFLWLQFPVAGLAAVWIIMWTYGFTPKQAILTTVIWVAGRTGLALVLF